MHSYEIIVPVCWTVIVRRSRHNALLNAGLRGPLSVDRNKPTSPSKQISFTSFLEHSTTLLRPPVQAEVLGHSGR